MKNILLVVFFGLFFVGSSLAQYKIPTTPNKQTSVYDYSKLLSSSEARRLEQKLLRYSDSTSTQIVLIIINSLKGEDINYLAANWAEKWKIGQKGKDNGVVLMMSKDDRKVAIQTGRGIEASLSELYNLELFLNLNEGITIKVWIKGPMEFLRFYQVSLKKLENEKERIKGQVFLVLFR